MTPGEITMQRFNAKTSTDHNEWFEGTKCILWTASAGTKNGHGRFWDARKQCWVAHRFAWVRANGWVPDGMVVSHRCPNRLCVNHLHLELITNAEMIRRRNEAFRPATTFRCCGRPRTPENSYPSTGQCKACHTVAVKRYRRKRRARKPAELPA